MQNEQAKLNPSYDTTRSPVYRLNDFLNKYHIQLNGTTPHEPFDFDETEDRKVGRCDGEYKEAIIDFVLALFGTPTQQK